MTAYELDFTEEDSVGPPIEHLHLIKGGCNGTVFSSEPASIRISSDINLYIILNICMHSNA